MSTEVGPIMTDAAVVMVAGHSVGKSAFCRLLLESTEIFHSATSEHQRTSIAKFTLGCGTSTLHIRTLAVDMVDPVSRTQAAIPLTLIDTPGIGFGPDGVSTIAGQLIQHVEKRLAAGLTCSSQEQQQQAGQQFAHLCLYFIDPARVKVSTASRPLHESIVMGAGQAHLPAADIDCIRQLSARMNVLPVIGMADTLTDARLAAIKLAIRTDLAEVGIGFGIFDDPIPNFARVLHGYPPHDSATNGARKMPSVQSLLSPPPPPPPPPLLLPLPLPPTEQAQVELAPYALISPEAYSHSDGVSHTSPNFQNLHTYPSAASSGFSHKQGHFTRTYRWGCVDVLDPRHSDFLALRSAIFFHMPTLRQYTIDYLFKKFSSSLSAKAHLHQSPSQPYSAYPPASGPEYLVANGHNSNPVPGSRPTVGTQSSPSMASSTGSNTDTMNAAAIASPKLLALPTSQPSKRRARKVSIACDLCRSRKLKCDGVRPSCGQCSKRSNPCEYVSQHKRRRANGRTKPTKPSPQSESESLEERSMDELSLSHSPEAVSRPMSRMSSSFELTKSTGRLSMVDSAALRSQPLSRPHAFSVSSDQLYVHRQPHDYNVSSRNNGIPYPASPSSTTHSPQLSIPIPQRKRSSTVPNRHTSGSRISNSGPKIIACNFCRARKTKCDGTTPSCASCTRRLIPCVYNMSSSQNSERSTYVGGHLSPATTHSMTASGSSSGYMGRFEDVKEQSSSSRPSSGSDELEIKRKSDHHIHDFQKRMRIDEEEESPFSHDSIMSDMTRR